MDKSPAVSGEEVIRRLSKFGFVKVRQRGSHVMLKKSVRGFSIGCVIPLRKSLAKGTLRGILRQANISPEDFDKMK